MRFSSAGFTQQSPEGEKICLNSKLWHSCAGPLVSLPAIGSRVVYFSQGHSEQVVSSRSLQQKSSSKNVFTVVEFALALQEVGCFSVVLKCALALLGAATATFAIRIPTIGIVQGLSVVAKLIDSLAFSNTPNNELDLTGLCCV
ncbi:unnamed protein product [Camellia sinensis]